MYLLSASKPTERITRLNKLALGHGLGLLLFFICTDHCGTL